MFSSSKVDTRNLMLAIRISAPPPVTPHQAMPTMKAVEVTILQRHLLEADDALL